ncbi:MAG: DUF3108 domain-containing protein [Acidiferrobacterales bacterium]|nr:DUF3108 domain-containing protein [Acidiferrobacterales bacterium]
MFVKNLLFVVFFAFSLGHCAVSYSQELKPIVLTYTVNLVGSKLGNATIGRLETSLSISENTFKAVSNTKAQGLAAILMGSDLHLNCEFSAEPGRALSKEYSGSGRGSEDFLVSYDWDTRKIKFSDGESLDMPPGDILDTCNMPFAVALLQDKGFGDDVLYVLEGSEKRIRGYKFRSSNPETLETPLGEMETLKIVLEREFKPDRTLSLWLSPSHNYLPIKIEDARSSRTISTLVNSIES